jgi:hypothetical protein
VQWNIERGYQLSSIIEQLQALDADVISLQEVCGVPFRSRGSTLGAMCRWSHSHFQPVAHRRRSMKSATVSH